MADDTIYGGFGATAYTPLNEWKYVPFYKKNVFTGFGQADQAANLITSPSFQSFWSSGGNQADYTTGIRVDSPTRDDILAKSFKRRNIDYTPNVPRRPTLPTPPPHIRPIVLDTWGYPATQNPLRKFGEAFGLGMETAQEAFEHGMFVPAKHGDIWPHMTAEEQAWWHERTRGIGGYNDQVSKYNAAKSARHEVPIELRNIRGALPRDQRMLVSTLNYGMDAKVAPSLVINPNNSYANTTQLRLINASDSSNLLGVSDELSEHVHIGAGKSRGRYSPISHRARSGISLITSTSPELPLALHEARPVLEQARQIRSEYSAIADTQEYMTQMALRPFTRTSSLPATPYDNIPLVERDPFPVSVERFNQEGRKIGTIVPSGNGTTTTVYGPPSRTAQWLAKGEQALHIGGKFLMVLGGVMEQFHVPDRIKGYYINALQKDPNWRPDPSDKLGMAMWAGVESALNFGSVGLYDQKERIFTDMTSGAGRGKGFYGTMVPPVGTTSVHATPDRYERQGISFNHVYPQAPR